MTYDLRALGEFCQQFLLFNNEMTLIVFQCVEVKYLLNYFSFLSAQKISGFVRNIGKVRSIYSL